MADIRGQGGTESSQEYMDNNREKERKRRGLEVTESRDKDGGKVDAREKERSRQLGGKRGERDD